MRQAECIMCGKIISYGSTDTTAICSKHIFLWDYAHRFAHEIRSTSYWKESMQRK